MVLRQREQLPITHAGDIDELSRAAPEISEDHPFDGPIVLVGCPAHFWYECVPIGVPYAPKYPVGLLMPIDER